jgi:hypothetical protein
MNSTTAISAQNRRTLRRILRTLKVTPAVMTACNGDSSELLLRRLARQSPAASSPDG